MAVHALTGGTPFGPIKKAACKTLKKGNIKGVKTIKGNGN
jgi:hypothetical protein